MQYRLLGKTGCKVSALGFGCMRLPTTDGATTRSEPVDAAAASRLVALALEQGITYYDTAYPYHANTSEAALGRALDEAGARKKVVVATKLPGSVMGSPEKWESIFAGQCKDLRTDYVDVYLAHALTTSRWKAFYENGGLDFFQRLKKEGRVKYLGFSFHDDFNMFKTIVDAFAWDMCQIQYNYLDTQFQAGDAGYAYAVERGLGVVSMESLKGGALARKPPQAIDALWQATPGNVSPADWALRWVLDKPGIAVALSGMGNAEEVAANCASADHLPGSLTLAQQKAIEQVREIFCQLNKVSCTGCGYCMPCPAGVNIPNVFLVYNQLGLFNDATWANAVYNLMAKGHPGRADGCVECGQCEEACPQHIEIRTKLKEAHAVLAALEN